MAPINPELGQKVELLLELENDRNILIARLQENQREQIGLRQFCNIPLSEPALSLRRSYCMRKSTELVAKDAELRSQIEVQAESIRQLQQQIQQLQRGRS